MDLAYKNHLQRGCRTTPIAADVAGQRFRSPRNSQYLTQTSMERFASKQRSYRSYYKTLQATHCRVCLAKGYRIETCPYITCSAELVQKRDANYRQMISSSFCGNSSHGLYNTGRYPAGNCSQRYDFRSKVGNRSQETSGLQRPLPTVQPP